MEIKIEIKGLEKIAEKISKISGEEFQRATASALNDAAFAVRTEVQKEMESAFDRVTPYIMKSVRVNKATSSNLVATVEPTYMGGKGVDPQKILLAEVEGGGRRDKRSEKALRRVGILPNGYVTVIPRDPFPGSDDGRGNIRGPFMLQLLTYFAAMGEQGYRANMTAKRKGKLAAYGKTESGYKTINGVVYFVSYGKLRGQHLHPGIWAKKGIHGVNVSPVLMFVKAPTYAIRLNFDEVLKKSDAQNKFEKRLRYHVRKIVEGIGG